MMIVIAMFQGVGQDESLHHSLILMHAAVACLYMCAGHHTCKKLKGSRAACAPASWVAVHARIVAVL